MDGNLADNVAIDDDIVGPVKWRKVDLEREFVRIPGVPAGGVAIHEHGRHGLGMSEAGECNETEAA